MDNKVYALLRSCVRQGVSNDDLGYLLRWAVMLENNYIKFLHKLETHSQEKFFDHSERIASIAAHYREGLEREIDSITL